MKYDVYKSDRELIIRDLEALEGVFVFPSQGYELISEDTNKFLIECILISYNANNDKPFQTSFLKHLARLDEHVFYAVFETAEFNNEIEDISPSTYIVNFIASINYHPFFVTNGNILAYGDCGEPFKDPRYENIDRFVGNGDFNPLLILLDKSIQRYVGGTEYQTEKFENAVIALRWIISCGFPYESIIDWDHNKIINRGVRNLVIANDVPFDTNFIVGNPEHKFCRLIRFGLREFMLTEKHLFEKLLNLNVVDPASSLLFFEIIKESITDIYIPNVQSLRGIFVRPTDKNPKKPEIFSPAFSIDMRISQPEGFTEKLLEEAGKHPTILGGLEWDLNPVKTIATGKQRYRITIYAKRRANILFLSDILENVRKICIRLLINSGLDEEYLTPDNIQFWLDYLEITMPKINQEITTACKNMFNEMFRIELRYSTKFRKLSNPKEDEIMFRLGFGFLSILTLDRFSKIQASSVRLDRSDPFIKAAMNYALSGNYIRCIKLLEEFDELFTVDRNSDMPSRFYSYITSNEYDLIPYLTKKHPMSFMSDEHYDLLKNDVKFFINNYDTFKDLGELIENVVRSSNEIVPITRIHNKLKRLGIYKEKDLSYIDDICSSISLFFGAQYKKSMQSA